MPKMPYNGTFQQALSAFRKANKSAMEMAVICSQMALQHYYDHGDTAYIQQFDDAMLQNWNRRNAFRQWVVEYSDAIFDTETGTWVKDKSADKIIVTDELKAASMAVPFYDFAPETPIKYYRVDDIDKAIAILIQRFTPKDDPEAKLQPDPEERLGVVIHLAEIKRALAGKVRGVEIPAPAVGNGNGGEPVGESGEEPLPETALHDEPQPQQAAG